MSQVMSCGATGVAPVLQVHPTRRCNLACAHCYTTSGPDARGELPAELLSSCVADAYALGYRQLAVSGGEPLVYGGLAPLLAAARSAGMLTSITTNGLLATPTRWASLAPLLDVVAVSIDGRPDEHDRVRGRAGAFARTAANLATIRASGVPFGFIFTLTQYNVDSVEFVVRLAADAGARSVQVHPLTLHGRAADAMADARPDGVELVAALYEAARLGEALGVCVHVDALTVQQIAAHRGRLVPARPVARLVDVSPVLVVDPAGTVIPFTHEVGGGLALGSLRAAPLAALADAWLAAGHGDELAAACERAWDELARGADRTAVYWYDEVAARAAVPSAA